MPAPHSRGKRSKKSKKGKTLQRQRTADVQPAAARPAATAAAATAPAAAAPAAAPRKASASRGPQRQYTLPEYPYVSGELVRIGIIAAVLIVILIILSVVL
jgi:hypothetical protein